MELFVVRILPPAHSLILNLIPSFVIFQVLSYRFIHYSNAVGGTE